MTRADRRKYHFIYKTTCIITGRYYVGMHSTDDMDDGYLGSGRFILNSIRRHGKDNHQREVVEMCESREVLRVREGEIVNTELLSDERCMNLDLGGLTGDFKDPSSTREKMRRAKLGKKQHPEWIAARAKGLLGHEVSDVAREKIRSKLMGHEVSEQTRQRLSKKRSHGWTAEQRTAHAEAMKRAWETRRKNHACQTKA